MKKVLAVDFMWHLYQVLIPFPVAIVTTVDAGGRPNAAPFGLLLPFCSDPAKPQLLLCASSMWHTTRNIEATGEFVVNYAPYNLIEQVAQTGLLWDEGVNEIEKAGLHAIDAVALKPPRIEECFQHIECRLDTIIRPTEQQTNFIADVVSISMNEELVGIGREEAIRRCEPLLLFGMDVTNFGGAYGAIGKTGFYAPPNLEVAGRK